MAVQKVFCALLLGVTTSLASLPLLVSSRIALVRAARRNSLPRTCALRWIAGRR